MKKVIALFATLILVASLTACGDRPVAYDYDEFDEPCYPNQQPNYQDGDYYIFNCGDRYRRVRRTRVVYVENPVYIPVIRDTDRESIYRTMPRTKQVDSGVRRSTSSNPTTAPSTTGSGVQRSTSSGTTTPSRSTSASSPSRSTSSSPSRSTSSSSSSSSKSSSSSPSRSTSSRRP